MFEVQKNFYKIKIDDKEYPERLREIKGAPQALYAKGNIDLLNNYGIGIVGSRKCDEYGIKQAKRFASFLSQTGLTVVSGLAKGIDSFAHYYSMKNYGSTIAVLPCGFNNIYPKENIKLADEIINNNGLLLSEWDVDIKVDNYKFPQRNRIISGLSIGVLVVESQCKSGSNITAHDAMKQGRLVFAIPGDFDNERSKGTNQLIKEGAYPVSSPLDIIDLFEYEGYRFNLKRVDVLDEYKMVYYQIGKNGITLNEISYITGLDISIIQDILFVLELDGFIVKENNKYYRKK